MFTPVPSASIRLWILPRPKKHATGMFFAPATQRPASSNPYSLAKRNPPQRGGFLFVSLAHFRYHQKTPQPIMYIRQHSFGMQPDAHGFSHGLKTCHRHVFLTAFRIPLPHQKTTPLCQMVSFFVFGEHYRCYFYTFLQRIISSCPHPYRVRS